MKFLSVLAILALCSCQTVNVNSESPGSSGQSLRPSEAVEIAGINSVVPVPVVAPADEE